MRFLGSGRPHSIPSTVLAVAATLSLLTLARPTRAESITMTFQGLAVSTPAPDGGSGGVMQFQGPTNLAQGTLGLFPGLPAQPGTNINTFCMDATRFLKTTDTYTVVYATPGTVSSWDSVPNLGGSATTAVNMLELFGTFFNGLDVINNPAFGGHGGSVNDQYAAFQDAVWILEGATMSNTLANYFVNNLGTTEATNVVLLSSTLAGGNGQNQISVIAPVPAPPGAVLAVMGFVSLAGYRFRSRRQFA